MFIGFLSEGKKLVEEIVPKMVAQTTEGKIQKGKTLQRSSFCFVSTDAISLMKNLSECTYPFYFSEPEVMPVEESVLVTSVPESKQQPTPKGI